MRVLVALAWLAACAGSAHATIANIDTDGFAQDGKTTYCEGVNVSKGPLVFEHLLPSSAGKCPLQVALTTTRRTNSATGATEIWVDWSASRDSSIDAASSLFPRAIDDTTGLPRPVIASLLRACKAGSNCATDSDVLVPAAVTGAETSTGEFDEEGTKPLRRFVFGVGAAAADLVVVAKIVLPGDAQLNISATEFITFQRVRIGASAASELPGTVKPSDTQASEAGIIGGEAKTQPATKSATSVDAQDTSSGAMTTPTRGGTTNIIVLSSIAGLGFIIAVAYFATAKRGNQQGRDHEDAQHTSTAEASIYRLTDAARHSGAALAAALAPPRGNKNTPTGRSSRRFQSRQQRTQAPWQITAAQTNRPIPAVGSHDAPPPALYHADLSVDGLTISGQAEPSWSQGLPSDLTSFNSLHDSEAQASDLTSFNSLHDSAVTLPEKNRQRSASSASSYADELQDSDHVGASRLFTESHISEVLQYQRSTATSSEDRGTELSAVSWLVEEERDSDLAELTTVIHERYPPRRP